MIKKVSSWVLGSFFRQFGRFLFFLVLGGLVFLLIQHNDINFKWTDLLGIETIKASTYETQWIPSTDISTNWGSSWGGLGSDDSGYYVVYDSITSSTSPANYWFRFKNNGSPVSYSLNGVEEISNTFQMNIRNINQFELDFSQYVCYMSNNIDPGTGQHYATSMICDPTLSTQNVVLPKVQYGIDIAYFYDNDPTKLKHCNIIASTAWNLTVSCPVSTNNISGFRITITNATTDSLLFSTGFYFSYTKKLDSTNQIIENQNQNTQDINNTLTDTNTTSDVSTADSFFNDTNSTSESAIADIVSTPLTLLNNLSVGTFNDICATLNNKQICLPSGDIIWNRQHGGAGVHDHWFRGGSTQAFITFFNLVVGGFILYKCLISLFHVVHKMLDPVNTYVEVMKL